MGQKNDHYSFWVCSKILIYRQPVFILMEVVKFEKECLKEVYISLEQQKCLILEQQKRKWPYMAA